LKKVDLSFVSFFNTNLREANEILYTDAIIWSEYSSSDLYRVLSQRNADPVDMYKFKDFFDSCQLDSQNLNNLNLINLFVPRFFTSLDDFVIYGRNGLFKDILPHHEFDQMTDDEYDDDIPF
jgi:hypothetical protein